MDTEQLLDTNSPITPAIDFVQGEESPSPATVVCPFGDLLFSLQLVACSRSDLQ